jgi:protein-disulfide isomerase
LRTGAQARFLAGLLAGLLATSAHAEGFDFENMTPEEAQAFGAQVRAYLLENPQVIMEAVAVLEERQAETQAALDDNLVADNLDALVNDGFSWVGGNPEGDVTIVEFMDYRCGYCRRAAPEVARLLEKDGNIRLIVKEYPILGEASEISARFAIATQIIAGDDAYEQMHNALVALDGQPGEAALTRLASTLGLDAPAILAEMSSDEVNRRLRATRALGQRMKINGTPSFVFGSQLVRGYAPLPAMEEIVSQERAKL